MEWKVFKKSQSISIGTCLFWVICTLPFETSGTASCGTMLYLIHPLYQRFEFSPSKCGPKTLMLLTFWLGNVLRATMACNFDIRITKSGPRMVCFIMHFGFDMCFAPQRRAISTSELPKVVWEWCVLHVLTRKCASRHNGGQFSNIRTYKSGSNP